MKKSFVWTMYAFLVFLLTFSSSATAQQLKILTVSGGCPVSGEKSAADEAIQIIAPLVTAVATKVVSAGIDKLVQVLSPQDRTLETSTLVEYFYTKELKPNPSLECLIISYGKLGVPPPDLAERFQNALNAPANNAFTKLPSNLPLGDIPDFYLEATLKVSPDKTAFTWIPRYVYFGKFFQQNWFAGNERDLRVQIDLFKPGEITAERSTSWQWTAIRPPLVAVKSAYLPESTWMTTPEPPTNPAGSSLPYTMKATIVETAKPYALANYLSQAIKENKDAIQKTVLEVVLPRSKVSPESASDSGAVTDP